MRPMTKVTIWIGAALLAVSALACFSAAHASPLDTLAAQAATPSPDDLSGFAKVVFEAAKDKDYRLLVATALVAVVWAMRKWGLGKLPGAVGAFFRSGRGTALSTFLLGFAGAMSTALLAKVPVTAGMFLDVAGVALAAAGGWSLVKHFISGDGEAPAAPPAPPVN